MKKERIINQTVIFDVDGTIADCEHRRCFVDGSQQEIGTDLEKRQ